MPVHRVVRVLATTLAVAVVLGTGVAWSNVRGFEDGIFHMSAPSLGKGGDDGAIDILLVGLDSRTDAHGNPLSAEELATLRAGDEEATNTDTIILIRIPKNNGRSATAISIPRDSYVQAPNLGKTKINGVYGQTREAKRASLVRDRGVGRRGRGVGHRGRARGADQDGRRPDRRHRRPLRRDRAARFRADHRRARRRGGLSQRAGVRTPFGCRLSGRPAKAERPAGAQFRPPAPRPAARRSGPGGAPAGGDGLVSPPGHLGPDPVEPFHAEPVGAGRTAPRW